MSSVAAYAAAVVQIDKGSLAEVTKLIERTPSLLSYCAPRSQNYPESARPCTLLCHALQFQPAFAAKIPQLLIEKGADVEGVPNSEKDVDCPLVLAVHKLSLELITLLVDKGARLDRPLQHSVLFVAITQLEYSRTENDFHQNTAVISGMVQLKLAGRKLDLDDGMGNDLTKVERAPLYRFLFVSDAKPLIALFIRAGANTRPLDLPNLPKRTVLFKVPYLSSQVIPENLKCAQDEARKYPTRAIVQSVLPSVAVDPVIDYLF